jgi:neutral ceramidase
MDRDLADGTIAGKARAVIGRSIAALAALMHALSGNLDAQAQRECPAITSGAGFQAGFGRRDLTPPTGAGLLGYGPEGRTAVGYRQRLKVRAMALRDGRGEHLALAVADLDIIPGNLHREVVRRVAHCAGLTADRVLLSATHTHAGPGQFTGVRSTDKLGTEVAGFDEQLQGFLADRIAQAILDALGRMRPARAGWGQAPVWRITRIRSWQAHMAEPHDLPSAYLPDSDLRGTPLGEVDPTLTVFRVDTAAGALGFAPAGAWAHFAIHGTGIPTPNQLYDADVHGVASRALELAIDAKNGFVAAGEPRAIAMFANGAEGNTRPETRPMALECIPPVLRREVRPGSWRTPAGGDVWLNRPTFNAGACLEAGIEDTRAVGERLGTAAHELFLALGDSLVPDMRLSRAFQQVPLRGPDAPTGLCSRPRTGMAQAAGAETRETRIQHFRWFGIVEAGMESGGSALMQSSDCMRPKKTPPGLLEWFLIRDHGFEEAAQFAVFRVGGMLLGGVPFEPTTTVGARMRRAMLEGARSSAGPERAVVVGLSGNYIGYVTTKLEYGQQAYEGGFTLYGPGSDVVYIAQLRAMVRQLAEAGWESPPVTVPDFPAYISLRKAIVRFGGNEPRPYRPRLLGVRHEAGRAILRWEDEPPGWLIPNRGTVVVVEEAISGGWRPVAWDGTLDIEVRLVKERRHHAVWEARWLGVITPGITYRFRLPDPDQPDFGLSREFRR